MSIGFFAVALPVVLFAGVSKGGFGSGAAFASASILALVLEPGTALGLMLPLLMLIDLGNLRPYWRRWSAPDARLLILGALPGVALGAALYRLADADLLRVLIGAVSLGFVAWQMALRLRLLRPSGKALPRWVGALWSMATGFTSFVSHAGGPPAAVWLLSRGLDKTTYQATTVILFWAVNIAKFIPYAFLGIFTGQTLLADLFLAPVALLGTWIGVRAHRAVPERAFFALTYLLLSATGAKLLWDGLT